MFATRASTQALRNGVQRTAQMTRVQASRGMGGGKYVRSSFASEEGTLVLCRLVLLAGLPEMHFMALLIIFVCETKKIIQFILLRQIFARESSSQELG